MSAHAVDALSGQGNSVWEQLIPDPSDMPALCDRQRFDAIVECVVRAEAPRVFAVVQEYGDRVDAHIAAWGMAFDDHAEVIDVDGRMRHRIGNPEDVVRYFHCGSRVGAKLLWLDEISADEEVLLDSVAARA